MSTPEKFEAMTEAAGGKLAEQFGMLREKAEFLIAEEMQVMKERGAVIDLGEDELAMLKSYRAFLARSKPGAVFSWRPSFTEPVFLLPSDPVLIRDPREVST